MEFLLELSVSVSSASFVSGPGRLTTPDRHVDRAWADWLHKSLENYPMPKDLVGKPTPVDGPVPASASATAHLHAGGEQLGEATTPAELKGLLLKALAGE